MPTFDHSDRPRRPKRPIAWCHPDAQPEIHQLGEAMLAGYPSSTPREIDLGGWHPRLILPADRTLDSAALGKLSGGANGHWSPTEHVATPLDDPHETCANFRGSKQCRELFSAENAATFPDEIARTG